MAVTSANMSGQPSPTTAEEVLTQLGGRIAMILDGGRDAGRRSLHTRGLYRGRNPDFTGRADLKGALAEGNLKNSTLNLLLNLKD